MHIRPAVKKILGLAIVAGFVTPLTVSSEVLYLDKEIEIGDHLYTRAASDDCSKVKIWRKVVKSRTDSGDFEYSLDLAIVEDLNNDLNPVLFERIDIFERSDICKRGGCYTKLEEPVRDAKRWLENKCSWRKD